MNKEFCMSCGHKNLFEINRPKFCAGCGSPLNTSLASITKSNSPSKQSSDDEDSLEEFDLESIDINAMRNGIQFEGLGRKVSLDDLWRSPAPSDGTRRPPAKGPEGKELLKVVQTECGPSKSRDIDE